MRLPQRVRDNLFFLIAETSSQVRNLQVLLETSSATVAQRILDRHGYTYNLKMRVYDGCLDTLKRRKKGEGDIFSLRAAEAIATDLDRITDLCHDCVRLKRNFIRKSSIKKSKPSRMLDDVSRGIDLLEKAIDKDDTKVALKIANIERKLDRSYDQIFKTQIKAIRKHKQPEDLVLSLYIAQRIEEMGDVLLNISESLMSAKLGQPMHTDRFKSLQMALEDLGLMEAEVDVEPIAQTKSGSGISGISPTNGHDDGYAAIFKDGDKEKLKEERESVESWHEIFPGLAPKILSFSKQGKNAALLIEHLPGQTFEQILLRQSDEHLSKTLLRLTKTLNKVWNETKRKKILMANHMGQLNKRLSGVLEVHPGFERDTAQISGHKVNSLPELIDQAAKLESKLEPAFSVYIHGDFNLDNIIYDHDSNKIRFIDLHRSTYQDYVQDVSVFMVSNYRLQVLDKKTRSRITQVACFFYEFASGYAKKHKDKTFELRLALGLARSFITSTRFILDQEQATKMWMNGIYILNSLVNTPKNDLKNYKLPIKDLFQ